VADLILECARRDASARLPSSEQFLQVAARLAPANITPRPAGIIEAENLRGAIVNPSEEGVRVVPEGVLLGGIIGEAGAWWEIGSEPPDGTYVLVRYSPTRVELLTDVLASRPLWYAHDDERLVVSTSQRAIVALLGDFRLERSAVSWMLATGSLGPEVSWDARVRRLPPDSRLSLDRDAWRATIEVRPPRFEPVDRTESEHLALLREALSWCCGELDISTDRWLLPLSGGVDSRTILAFMVKAGRSPKCVTWTTRESLRNPLSDAFIARRLARKFRVEHDYELLDGGETTISAALQLFIEANEGCTDEFAGYVDGCAVWRDLFAAGTSGIIRGDEPLGAIRRAVSFDVARIQEGGLLLTDYPEDHVVRHLGLTEQEWPERLRPQPGEQVEQYLDRLEQTGWGPGLVAPLNALKGRYLEVVNPLSSRRIVDLVRTFPDALRGYGRAFSTIADKETWPIPHARYSSTPDVSDYLADQAIVADVVTELTSAAVERVLSEEAATTLLVALATPSHGRATVHDRVVAALKAIRVVLPSRMANRLTPPYTGPDDPVSAMEVAFRATLASRTVSLLLDDARVLEQVDA